MTRMIFKLIAITLLGGTLLWACSETIIEKEPKQGIVEDTYFQTPADALGAIYAAYDPLQYFGMYSNVVWTVGDIRSDDALKGDGGAGDSPDWIAIDNFTATNVNAALLDMYTDAYRGIFRTNAVLNKIPQMEQQEIIDPELSENVQSEARFLRALYYFNLARTFGDVPVIDSLITSESQVPASPEIDVYELIISDLEYAAAEGRLPVQYPEESLGRATRGAALALLAKVHLTLGNFAEAAQNARAVIDLGVYELLPNYADNFTLAFENSVESVFEVQFANGLTEEGINDWFDGGFGRGQGSLQAQYTGPRISDVSINGYGFDMPTEDFVSAFEPGDPRLAATVYQAGDITPGGEEFQADWTSTGYAIKKYLDVPEGIPNSDSPLNFHVIRYSDVLLMYAEALNENGQTDEAATYLNQVRERVGLAPKTGLNQAALREAIYQERRVELGLEAHRWYDLVRTGRAIEVMRAQGYNIGEGDLRLPLPQGAIDLNPALVGG